METIQQNGRFTLFSSKFLSIYSILYDYKLNPLRKCYRMIFYSTYIYSLRVATFQYNIANSFYVLRDLTNKQFQAKIMNKKKPFLFDLIQNLIQIES